MNEEEINKMCIDIYEGEDWQPMKDYIKSLQTQLQQKENIIKEVREYIKTKMEIRKKCENVYSYDIRNDDYIKQVDKILEILDKEVN